MKKWIFKKPQFKSCLLRETGFHQPSFLSEIKEVKQNKNMIDQELVKELENVEFVINNEQTKKREYELRIEALQKAIEDLDKESLKWEEKISASELRIKSVSNQTKSVISLINVSLNSANKNNKRSFEIHIDV